MPPGGCTRWPPARQLSGQRQHSAGLPRCPNLVAMNRSGTVIAASCAYFAIVFGVGFVLGVVRQLLLVAWLSERWAELCELPLMVVSSYLAARWVVRRFGVPSGWSRIGVGATALGLLLVAEFAVVLSVRGLTIGEYIAGRDPVAGLAYVVALAIFAIMPAIIEHGESGNAL